MVPFVTKTLSYLFQVACEYKEQFWLATYFIFRDYYWYARRELLSGVSQIYATSKKIITFSILLPPLLDSFTSQGSNAMPESSILKTFLSQKAESITLQQVFCKKQTSEFFY